MKYYAPTKLSENIHETPEGYLLCLGVSIGRVGEMKYGPGETPLEVGADGFVYVSRSEEELFRPETVASFEGKSFTIKHPEDFVGPENWAQLSKGVLQNVRRGEDDELSDLIADVLVTEKTAIAMVKAGLREVSCGYEAEYIQTGKGKGKQTNIVGNHLALVEEGRAGPAYAINDQKDGTIMKKKLGERIKELFAQTADEASKILDEAPEEKKEDKKEEAKDDGAYSFDELVKAVKDLGEKVSAMAGKKEEKSEDEPDSADKEKKVDEEKKSEDEPKSLEDRLSALEAALAKLMEGKSMAGDEEEEEESVEDDDAEEEVVTGDTSDTASRAEILAPGIKLTKDVKAQALKQAYATKDGKVAIDTLTGGKPLKLDSAEAVELLFVGVSEMLKASRTKEFSKSKQVRDFAESPKTPMTAERMNEINAARYKLN